MKRKIFAILFALVLVVSLTLVPALVSANPGQVVNVDTSEQFSTIQAAIDDPETLDGHTIIVAAGYYTENVNVDKQLTVRAQGVVTVTASNPSDHVFEVTANHVNISGFTVTGATNQSNAGIYLDGVEKCNISENTASNNHQGIFLWVGASKNQIEDNLVSDSVQNGIILHSSSNDNKVKENQVYTSGHNGIILYNTSNNNKVLNNVVSGSGHSGILVNGSSKNQVKDNVVSGSGHNGIQVYYNSSKNKVEDNLVSDSGDMGIAVGDNSNENHVKDNLVCGSVTNGINVYTNSSMNKVEDNSVCGSGDSGILVSDYSSENKVKKNKVANSEDYDLSWDGTGTGNTWEKNKYETSNLP